MQPRGPTWNGRNGTVAGVHPLGAAMAGWIADVADWSPIFTLIALFAFLRFTNLGVALRASSQRSDRASLLGVNVGLVHNVAWIAATLVAAVARVPYVALAPGPTFNTLGQVDGKPVIAVTGHETYDDTGNLNMTTISVVTRLTLVQALRGWFQHDLAVVPVRSVPT